MCKIKSLYFTSRPKVRKAPLKNLSMRNIWPARGSIMYRCMFVCNGVFSRIRVLVSIVGLVNSVNILLSELFCDTYSRFHSFTSLLNMNLSFLGGGKKGLPVQYSYRTASNHMKKRASNGSVKYCKCHERTKSCIGGANKGCGYIMGVGVGCHTI